MTVWWRGRPPLTSTMDTQRTILTHLLGRPLSLAGLGTATRISLPTLRRAVQALQRAGWVRVVGREDATGGRPANLFGVDLDTHVVVGVHLAHPGLRLVATDLAGAVLDERVPADVTDLDHENVPAQVLAYLSHLQERFPARRVLGVALASPGYVDPATGTVITIGRVPNWNNLPICERLREATELPVTIGNDVDAMATAEFGGNGDARTYAYVGVSEGVKFSMFLHGKPYVGPFGNAGLVNPRLLAGGVPPAEDVLSVQGLTASFLADRGTSSPDPESAERIRRLPDAHDRYRAVLDLAEAGDPRARAVVASMTDLLGAQIASFVYLIQPELLVVGGALAGAPEGVLADVEAALRKRLSTLLGNNLIVRRARVTTPNAAAIGAAQAFVQRLLVQDGPPLASTNP